MAARVAVVGGGPGGLVAALALARRGVAVTVFERAAGYAPTSGGGFGLAFNGAAALKAISPAVHAAVARVSMPFSHWSLGDGRGGIAREMRDAPMLRMDDGSPALAGALRAEVLAVLRDALPPGALVLGADVTAVTPGGGGRPATVTVKRLSGGGGGGGGDGADADTHEFDAVVAADGVRSRVRAQLWRDDPHQPVYSGAEVFYGVPRPSPELLGAFEYAGPWVHQSAGVGRAFITAGCRVDATAASFGLPGPSAGCYYGFTRARPASEVGVTAVSSGHWDEGGTAAAAAITTTGSGTGTGAGLTVSGQAAKDDLWREVRDGAWGAWGRAAVDATPPERLLRFPMFWRLPPPRWHVGRVALMGDAAHTPLPTAGQGLNMAVEDAYLLGNLLGNALTGLPPGTGKGTLLWRADLAAAAAGADAGAGSTAPPPPPPTGAALDAAVTAAYAAFQAARHGKTTDIITMSKRILAMEVGVAHPVAVAARDALLRVALPLVLGGMKAEIKRTPVV